MIKILFLCHGNILTNFKFSYKIKNGRGQIRKFTTDLPLFSIK